MLKSPLRLTWDRIESPLAPQILWRLESLRQRWGTLVQQVVANLIKPHAIIAWLESLPFDVLHLPLGPLPAHVDGMVRVRYLKEENIFQVNPQGNIISKEYIKSSTEPQVFQYRIQSDDELTRIVTDSVELSRIRQAASEQWTGYSYPTISLMNPPALEAWAVYMGMRLPKDNEEQESIFNSLQKDNQEPKSIRYDLPWEVFLTLMKIAGIPCLGFIDADTAQVICVGDWTWLLTSHQPKKGRWDTLCLDFVDREGSEGYATCNATSALLLRDKKDK